MIPHVAIEVEGAAVSHELQKRLEACVVTDSMGSASDTAVVTVGMEPNDAGVVPALPPKGAVLSISMGYETPVLMGRFVVDAHEVTGPPDKVAIHCNAANVARALGVTKTKAWGDVTLADVVTTLANDMGLRPALTPDFATHAYQGLNQTGEGSLSFLNRLASDLGGQAKVVAGHLVVAYPGEGRSISGRELPVVPVRATDLLKDEPYRYLDASRTKQAGVRARWWSAEAAAEQLVEVGEAPFSELRNRKFTNEADALAAAKAELDRRNRGASTFDFSVAGDPNLLAEVRVAMTDMGVAEINRSWSVKTAVHSADDAGYKTSVACEVPKT